MKKTTTKTISAVKARPEKKKEVTKIYCDFCPATVPSHGSYGWDPRCSLCDRDTCRTHNSPDPYEPSDYPNWYCNICYKLRYDIYQNDYLKMIDRHREEEDKFFNMIKEKSLENFIS